MVNIRAARQSRFALPVRWCALRRFAHLFPDAAAAHNRDAFHHV
jgi:hypothetical protein